MALVLFLAMSMVSAVDIATDDTNHISDAQGLSSIDLDSNSNNLYLDSNFNDRSLDSNSYDDVDLDSNYNDNINLESDDVSLNSNSNDNENNSIDEDLESDSSNQIADSEVVSSYSGANQIADSEIISSNVKGNSNALGYDDMEEDYISTEIHIIASNVLLGEDAVIYVNLTKGGNDSAILNEDFFVYFYDEENFFSSASEFFSEMVRGSGYITVPASYLEVPGRYYVYAEYEGDVELNPTDTFRAFNVIGEKQDIEFYVDYPPSFTPEDKYLEILSIVQDSEGTEMDVDLDVYVNGVYNQTIPTILPYWDIKVDELIDYNVELVFAGDSAYNPANYSFTIYCFNNKAYFTIDAPNVSYGEDAYITVSLYDFTSGHRINNASICINITEDDSPEPLVWTYTSNNGYKYIDIPASNLKANTPYKIDVLFEGNDEYASVSDEAYFDVVDLLISKFDIYCDSTVLLNNESKVYYKLSANDEAISQINQEHGSFNLNNQITRDI